MYGGPLATAALCGINQFRMTTTMMFYYCGTYCADNARIAENHHRQRQKISVEKYETCRRLLRSEAAVDARWYTDFTDDVRCQTCHQRIRSQDNNPDRGEHDWNIYHALFVPLLQT